MTPRASAEDPTAEVTDLLQLLIRNECVNNGTVTGNPVDENGNAIGSNSDTSGDDSFGAQVLLKDQERVRPFTLSAGATGSFVHGPGTGGQVDFVRAANRSRGGKSFIVLPSTAKDGTVSRIVPTLSPGTHATTSKNDGPWQ